MNNKTYLILDFDECLFEHPDNLDQQFCKAYAETAIEMGCPLDLEEAKRKAIQSFQERDLSHYIFADYGLDIEELYLRVHPHLFQKYVMRYEDEIRARNLRPYFDNENFECAVLTHGTTQWASDILNLLGMSDLFPDERIIGLEKAKFQLKSQSEYPYNLALSALGLSRHDIGEKEIIFVDDHPGNHKIPHAMGLHTILVTGRHYETPEETSSIKEIHPSLYHFLDTKKKAAPKDGQVYG